MLLSNGQAGLSWPRIPPKTSHRCHRPPPVNRLRRKFPPTPQAVPVRPNASTSPTTDDPTQTTGEPSEDSASAGQEEISEQVLYATLSRPTVEVDKPDLKKGPVLMKKPVGGVTKGEKGSQVNEKGPAKPQAGGQKLMEDLGTLFTEVGFGGGVQGQPSGRLSRALDQGMSDLKDGKRGKRGNKMPSSMGKGSRNAAVSSAPLGHARPELEKPKDDNVAPASPTIPELTSPALKVPRPPKAANPERPQNTAPGRSWGARSSTRHGGRKSEARQAKSPGSRVARASAANQARPPTRTAPRTRNPNPSVEGLGTQTPPRTSVESVVAPKPEYLRSKPPAHQSDDAVLAYFKSKHRTPNDPPGQDEKALAADGSGIAPRQGRVGPSSSIRNKGNDKKQSGNAGGAKGSGNKRQRKAFEGQFGGTSAQNRRKARQQRQERRDSRATTQEREEIIEVGEEGLLVNDLAAMLAVEPAEILKTLFMKGIMATVTQTLDMDTVKVVGLEFGVEVWDKGSVEVSDMAKKTVDFLEEDETAQLILRPPVVTVMGHVDHGKTSLLDYIRQTSVASGEAGGITQAIGAYTCEVTVDSTQKHICFLDTPGHEAFSAMRARGARVTDMAIIIVAADDGIQPQTREAVNHAKAAGVPVVVAINKIDKEGANPEQIKQQLGELELIPEDWGGKTPVIPISAKTGKEIELELMANPNRAAAGTVVEADLDRRAGPVATLLVQNGTLHVGDMVVSGASYGKVRSLTNDSGDQEAEAGPSVAVRMLGLSSVPVAGESFEVVADESAARQKAKDAGDRLRSSHLAEVSGGGSMVTLSSLASIDEDDEAIQRVNIVLKADTSGAIEAVKGALSKLPQDSVMLRFLHAATGDITESDLSLADTAEGFVLAYNIKPTESISASAKKSGVDIRSYDVIYDLLDDIRAAMEGRIKAVTTKVRIGSAEVRGVFSAGSRTVAGCMVTDGRLEKECVIEVYKKKKKRATYEGKITSLRRVKEVVSIVEAGLECGLGSDFENWDEGDRIEAFTLVSKTLSLEEAHATAAVDLEKLKDEIDNSPDN